MPALDWSFLFVVATLLLTPGPTNTLLASAGLARGLAPALRLLPVECLGYLLATTLWGLLMQGLVLKFPAVRQLVQLLSSLYLARLGWRM